MNTDDYEGHTPGPWRWDFQAILQGKETVLWCDFLEPDPDWQLHNSAIHVSEKDEMLIAAAPDLLAEVKRLRSIAWDLYLFYTDMGYDGSLSMIEDRMDWVPDEAFYGGEEE